LDSHDQNVITNGIRGRYFAWFKTSEQSQMLKTSKEYALKLDLPLFQIYTNEHFFQQLNALSEYTKLIDYLFRMNVDYLDFVYPEIYGIYGGHTPKYKIDTSYRKIYMKKFEKFVKEKSRQ
jgi:hypothetical protein